MSSRLIVNSIRHTGASGDAVTLANDGTCTANITNNLSNRNKIINGSMIISQRGGSFTSTSSEYMMDRFEHVQSGSFTFDTTTTQDASGPVGFRKCLKITPDSTQTPTGGMNGMIQYKIEGQDLQDLCFGTSSAKKITLSFYAKSSTQNNNHQYTLQIRKYDDSNNRNMVTRAFTVTSSWQRFTMTFDGDTAENIRNDNATGMQILWHLADGPDDIHAQVNTFSRTTNSSFYTAVTGQSNFMDNTSNEFYLTGVQLEVGSVATDFEHRSYHDELHRCFRYYYVIAPPEAESLIGDSLNYDTSDHCTLRFPVEMRVEPSFICSDFSNAFRIYGSSGGRNVNTLTVNTGVGSTKCIIIECAGGTNGSQNFMRIYNANSGVYATIAASAEL